MRMAIECQLINTSNRTGIYADALQKFADLIRADEREQIEDEWSMCIQSDLEHGVKSLNETAAKEFHKNYPEIAKFWGWLNARGNT